MVNPAPLDNFKGAIPQNIKILPRTRRGPLREAAVTSMDRTTKARDGPPGKHAPQTLAPPTIAVASDSIRRTRS